MKKYALTWTETYERHAVVEAEDEDHAMEKFWEQDFLDYKSYYVASSVNDVGISPQEIES